jgi:uncharacterized protein (DUF1015 family)
MTENAFPLVAPFLGERYEALDALSSLISPPYDVISPERRADLTARAEHNIVNLILPEGNGDRYDRAKHILDRWREAGVLETDDAPSVHVVRQEFETPGGTRYARTGMIAAVAVESYEGGRVKPHERTHKGPKEDRLALMRATQTMFEALLMLAPDREGDLRRGIELVTASPPLATAELDGVAVSMWRCSGTTAEKLCAASSAASVYIADGHHRYETAVAYRGENPRADRTLGLIIPLGDPGLVVLPTHRILSGASIDTIDVPGLLRDGFAVETIDTDADPEPLLASLRGQGTCCVIDIGGRSYSAVLRESADLSMLPAAPSVRNLDVARIDALVVEGLLARAGGDASLGYTADAGEARRAARSGGAVAVLVNPTDVEQVLAVADAGAFMPQKSTFFQPKAPSGLVMMDVGR